MVNLYLELKLGTKQYFESINTLDYILRNRLGEYAYNVLRIDTESMGLSFKANVIMAMCVMSDVVNVVSIQMPELNQSLGSITIEVTDEEMFDLKLEGLV